MVFRNAAAFAAVAAAFANCIDAAAAAVGIPFPHRHCFRQRMTPVAGSYLANGRCCFSAVAAVGLRRSPRHCCCAWQMGRVRHRRCRRKRMRVRRHHIAVVGFAQHSHRLRNCSWHHLHRIKRSRSKMAALRGPHWVARLRQTVASFAAAGAGNRRHHRRYVHCGGCRRTRIGQRLLGSVGAGVRRRRFGRRGRRRPRRRLLAPTETVGRQNAFFFLSLLWGCVDLRYYVFTFYFRQKYVGISGVFRDLPPFCLFFL